MPYTLLIRKEAKKKLHTLSSIDRSRIVEKITRLGIDPDDPRLDIKKLVGTHLYRLRVGDWRIIFGKQETIRIISIEKIDARGGVYQ